MKEFLWFESVNKTESLSAIVVSVRNNVLSILLLQLSIKSSINETQFLKCIHKYFHLVECL